MDFYHLQEKTKHKYWIKDQMLPKIADEFISNKTADVVTKSNDDKIVKQETVEEIIIPPEKREGVSNKLRRV